MVGALVVNTNLTDMLRWMSVVVIVVMYLVLNNKLVKKKEIKKHTNGLRHVCLEPQPCCSDGNGGHDKCCHCRDGCGDC